MCVCMCVCAGVFLALVVGMWACLRGWMDALSGGSWVDRPPADQHTGENLFV